MENIGAYLLQITGCALICSVVLYFLGEKGMVAGAVKLLCAAAMVICVLSPWANMDLRSYLTLSESFAQQGQDAADAGENSALAAMEEIISQQTGAYILDKAVSLGADLTVTVQVRQQMPPVPCGVSLQGSISPYGKQLLSDWLEKEFGIAREAQQWN